MFSTIVGPLEQCDAARRTSSWAIAASTSTTVFSSTGIRQRLRRGAGTWSVSWDTARTTSNSPLNSFDPALQSGFRWRSRSRCCADRNDRFGAAAIHHREAESGELRTALPRVRRADGGCGQAGVLDAESDGRQRLRSAAVARAGAGARAPEQDPRRRRADSAAGSRAGGSRSRAAARKPDSRQRRGWRRGGWAAAADHEPERRVVLERARSIRSRSRAAARPCPTSTRPWPTRWRVDPISRARTTISRTRRTNVQFLSNQKLPDVRLETSYRGSGLGGTQFLRTGGFPGVDQRDARPELRRRARSGVHARIIRRWSVGVTVNYPLGTQLRRGQPRTRRDRASSGGRSVSRACRLQTAETVRQAARQVRSTAERVDAARASATLAQQRFDSEQRRYEVGLSTTFLVTQAQRDSPAGAGEPAADDARLRVVAGELRGGGSRRRRSRPAIRSGVEDRTSSCCRRPHRAAHSGRGPEAIPMSESIQQAESIQQVIVRQVSAWPGVTVGPNQFGGVRAPVRTAGAGAPARQRARRSPVSIADPGAAGGSREGRAAPRAPESGWVSVLDRTDADVERVVEIVSAELRPAVGNVTVALTAAAGSRIIHDVPESIAQHRKPRGEERLLHRHEDLTAVGEQIVDALRLLVAVHASATGRRCEWAESGPAGCRRRAARFRRAASARAAPRCSTRAAPAPWRRVLAVLHHHRDLPAEVLLVESEAPARSSRHS